MKINFTEEKSHIGKYFWLLLILYFWQKETMREETNRSQIKF
jgi:hypothetical protein